jgi:NitT/TauT family transport system ATP-binding protein
LRHSENRPALIQITNLSKSFPTRNGEVEVLRGVSFEVGRSEFVAIVGPSGCGKTTLLRIVAGLSPVSSGQVLVDRKPVRRPGTDRGMVFQDFSLFPWLTVQQNIAFGLSIRHVDKRQVQETVRYYLSRFGLLGFEDFYPEQISRGMRQRVAIARTLANDPRILLLDEPFGSLDAYTRTIMQDFFVGIVNEVNNTILLVTHDISEALYMADRVVVLSDRPTCVIAEVPVDMERPRDRADTYSHHFQELVKQIRSIAEQWQQIDRKGTLY